MTIGEDGDENYQNCTNVSPPQRGGAVSALLSERWAEMARQLPRGPDNPVAPNPMQPLQEVGPLHLLRDPWAHSQVHVFLG